MPKQTGHADRREDPTKIRASPSRGRLPTSTSAARTPTKARKGQSGRWTRFIAGAWNRRCTRSGLLVADFTYVRLPGCFAYTAFVIDAYANRIVGGECSTSKQTRFVEVATRQAAVLRAGEGHPLDGAIHPSDVGSRYTSVHFGETPLLNGVLPSIGSVGDAFDNALAETTTIGLYKHECVRVDSPFRRGPLDRLSDLEMITADWVHWYNTSRLMHHLGRIPPAEAEANYDATTGDDQPTAHT